MKLFGMAALVAMGAILAGCAKVEEDQQQEDKSITLTTTIGFSDEGGTKALTAEGVKTFSVDDRIALVYKDENNQSRKAVSNPLTVDDIYNEGKSAHLKFTLDYTPANSGAFNFIYPAAMVKEEIDPDDEVYTSRIVDYSKLDTQDGLLATIGSSLDLCSYMGNFSDAQLPASVTLENRLAILAITLKNSDGTSEITGDIKQMTLTFTEDYSHSYTINRTAAEGPIYVAIEAQYNANVEITANDGTNYYVKSLTDKSYTYGNGYNVSWRMERDPLSVPLTLEAITDGTIVVNNAQYGMQYSLNGGDKTTVSRPTCTIDVTTGDKVAFYGNKNAISSYYSTTFSNGTAQVKVYGNIMSLVNEDSFVTAKTLTFPGAFSGLFNYYSALTDASGLKLPATTLSASCYSYMFGNCANLTTAPEILPAMTLAQGCYGNMFENCSNLTSSPVLPAATLVQDCYNYMFRFCSKLQSVTCLATNIPASGYTHEWLHGVANKGTFTKASSLSSWPITSSGIPSGWTVVNYQK